MSSPSVSAMQDLDDVRKDDVAVRSQVHICVDSYFFVCNCYHFFTHDVVTT